MFRRIRLRDGLLRKGSGMTLFIIRQDITFLLELAEKDPFDQDIAQGGQKTRGTTAAEPHQKTIEQEPRAPKRMVRPTGIRGQQKQAAKQSTPEAGTLDAVDKIVDKFDQGKTGLKSFFLVFSMEPGNIPSQIVAKRLEEGAPNEDQGHADRSQGKKKEVDHG